MERVPAGVYFKDAEVVYSIYGGQVCDASKDVDNLKTVLAGFQLLEDDYLGGQGTRGAGKVELVNIRVGLRSGDYIDKPAPLVKEKFEDLSDLTAHLGKIQAEIRKALSI